MTTTQSDTKNLNGICGEFKATFFMKITKQGEKNSNFCFAESWWEYKSFFNKDLKKQLKNGNLPSSYTFYDLRV